MDTYNPSKLTAAPKKVDISLRQLADFDQTGGDRDRVDNVRDNQVLVSLSKFNRPKTFSFRYISDILIGGNGVTISTDKNGITTISNSGVRKIIAGTNVTISPVSGLGDVTINAAGGSTGLAVGTTPITSGTVGRVLFEGTGNVLQESANLFWDNTNGRLGIGGTPSTFTLDVNGTARVQGDVQFGLAGAATTSFRFYAGTSAGVQGNVTISGLGVNGVFLGLGGGSNATSGNNLGICRAYLNEYGNVAYGFIGLDNAIPMTFRFGAYGSSVEALRLTNTSVILRPTTGNVLIGTTTDAGYKLDVNGTFRVQGRQSITSDTSVTTQTSSVIQATTTNANLVLTPNGTGSILASIPDGTAVGGNARGANSVDLQMSRASGTQVSSSDFGVIAGGQNNQIQSGNESKWNVISGGSGNRTIFGNYVTIGGGRNNIGGSSNGSLYATVVGGFSNTAGGTGSTVGGESNNVGTFAADSTAFGRLITISNQFSGGIGYNFSMSGESSFGLTANARSTAYNTTLLGVCGHAYLPTQLVHGTGYSAPVYEGSHQSSEILPIAIATLTSGQTSAISFGATLIIPTGTDRIWNVEINTTAVVTAITGTATGVAIGNVYIETKKFCFKKVGGISSVVGAVDTVYVKSDGGMTTASVTAAAGASQSLALTFTAPTFVGGGSVSVRVLSKVDLVEIAY